jgi:hypothetical protein
MTGYLQRLIDAATPAAELPALTPVVKSTSPVFEQDQLLGLFDHHLEADAEVVARPAPYAPDAPDPFQPAEPAARAPVPAVPAYRPYQPDVMTPPTSSGPRPEPTVVDGAPLPLPSDAARTRNPPPQERSDASFEAPSPVPMPTGSEPWQLGATDVAPGLAATAEPPSAREPSLVQLATTLMMREAATPGWTEATPGPAAAAGLPGEAFVVREPAPGLDPPGSIPEVPAPPVVLEPRPRPHFADVEPKEEQPDAPSLQAAPRISIGRVTVEIVPDPEPAARAARVPRTAAAASMIGPLGNRRARRRLFALSRL